MSRQLGVAIYPDKMNLVEIENYLKTAWENNFTRAYLTFLPINLLENNQATLLPQILAAISLAKRIGFEVTTDINQRVMDDIGINLKDLSWFREHQIDVIRFDLPMNSNTIANLTYNSENIKIELQMSNDNFALADILSYDPKKSNLIGCQNFYPQTYTALSWDYFMKTSIPFTKNGIKTTCYLSTNNKAAFCSWPNHDGTPTIEIARHLDIVSQAKLMWASQQVDDLIIANCPASEQELIQLGKTNRDIFEIKLELEANLNEVEKEIILKRQHQNRGDVNDFFIRSTATRVEFKNIDNLIRPAKQSHFEIGDVLIGNDKAGLYKNELQIVTQTIVNTGEKNLVAKIFADDLELIKHLKPWQRFFLRT